MRPLLASLCLVLVPTLGHAHAIGLDCTLRGNKVEVEVYYDDDSPAQKAKIEVVGVMEEIIISGITDEKGKWSFAAPVPGKYEVRVDGGAGHRAKRSLTIPGPKTAESKSVDPALAPDAAMSEGADRAEFTSVPWLKIVIGLFVIGSCAGVFLLVSILRGPASRAP